MKIGIIGTVWLNIPPIGYGGTEQVIFNIVTALIQQGHDVTLFAPQTANVPARVIPTLDRPLRDVNISWENVMYPLSHLTQVYEYHEKFDILHMHLNKSQDYIALPFALYRDIPTLFTLHFRIPDAIYKSDRYMLLHKYRALPFSSISQSQQTPDKLNYVANVYNSLDIADYPFVPTPDDYFVWLGKMIPIKGPKEAIIAAKKAGVKLIVMGAIEPGVTQAVSYFEEEIMPLIDGKQIILKENVTLPEKAQILGHAKAMLNPILWEEPFGLVMIESQATGTPVIAFNRGAAPEVIQDGHTGFLVYTIDEIVEKMKQVDTIDRRACRDWVQRKFSNQTMAQDYLQAYQTVINKWDYFTKHQWDILYQEQKENIPIQ